MCLEPSLPVPFIADIEITTPDVQSPFTLKFKQKHPCQSVIDPYNDSTRQVGQVPRALFGGKETEAPMAEKYT